MKLQFDANQGYQLQAINSVVDVFEGQTVKAEDLSVTIRDRTPNVSMVDYIAVGNNLIIDDAQIGKNVLTIQKRNGIGEKSEISKPFTIGKSTIGGPDRIGVKDIKLAHGMNFTVEMETGTGKTYVYLRTIHELYKNFGFKKFIVVVPSIAIKEGVLKNLEITKEHFASLYNNPEIDWHVWNPKKRGQARQFATNDSLQVLVINIDSLAGAGRIIKQASDWGVPMEFIGATNPIVIVDEPQNMETDIRRAAIEDLNPLCTLRYSATHRNLYNLLYKLDPVKAYDLGLVKRIEVDSVFSEDAFNAAYVHLVKIERPSKSGLVAKVEIDKDDARGLQRQAIRLQPGDDLEKITSREVYSGYILDRVNAEEEYIEFSNGVRFYLGQRNEGLGEEIIKYQIERTVENHFEKELSIKNQGIKVLSLFFIDRVSNYREYTKSGQGKGKFAKWFEESYKKVQSKPKYRATLKYTADVVHNGYFSQDKNGQWKDTRGNTVADDETYELIMRNKERLLDPVEPLRFIFSHSALREGWDNPNVFQICTLNETSSELKKRQEIGRGLRLPVNTEGLQVHDESINILTVTANESYEDFASKLQSEIEDETGVEFKGRIKDRGRRRKLKLRKGYKLDDNFRALWDRIKHKTRYSVTFDSSDLVNVASKRLAEIRINQPRIRSVRARLDINEAGVEGIVKEEGGSQPEMTHLLIPDVMGKIQSHTRLTRRTIFEILKKANKFADIIKNPQQVIDEAVRIINQVMNQLMVDGIKYDRLVGKEWEMRLFESRELESYLENMVEVHNKDKTLFDYVLVDSDIERSFASELETRDEVKFYFKLPSWFSIDTPLGNYNPDWAIVFEKDKRIYFVAETKGTGDLYDESLGESERGRIKCGKAYFEILEDVEFRGPITEVGDLIN